VAELGRGDDLPLGHLAERLHGGEAAERRRAGEHLVEDGAQGVDVGPGVDLLAAVGELLRGHVRGGAQDLPRLRAGPLGQDELGEPEVADLGGPGLGHQDVGRVEVAVDDPGAVGDVDGPRQGLDQPGGPSDRLGRGPHHPGEGAAVDELHDEEREALVVVGVEDLDDVRVGELGGGLGLGAQAGALAGVGVVAGQDHLDRDDPARVDLAGLVDDPHAAPADLLQDVIAADAPAGARRGRLPRRGRLRQGLHLGRQQALDRLASPLVREDRPDPHRPLRGRRVVAPRAARGHLGEDQLQQGVVVLGQLGLVGEQALDPRGRVGPHLFLQPLAGRAAPADRLVLRSGGGHGGGAIPGAGGAARARTDRASLAAPRRPRQAPPRRGGPRLSGPGLDRPRPGLRPPRPARRRRLRRRGGAGRGRTRRRWPG